MDRSAWSSRSLSAVPSPREKDSRRLSGVGAVIDFDQYEAEERSFAVTTSTLTVLDAEDAYDAEALIGQRHISLEVIRSKIPSSILRTFEPNSLTLATLDDDKNSNENNSADARHDIGATQRIENSAIGASGAGLGTAGATAARSSSATGSSNDGAQSHVQGTHQHYNQNQNTNQSNNQQGQSIEKEGREGILRALSCGLARALQGDSMVTAPVLYKNAPWLGRISVSAGDLKGNVVTKYRTYFVQGEVLAGGHVLPWKLGRIWRYSELRRVLVDDLQVIVSRYGLEDFFTSNLYNKFPGKNWSGRNKPELANLRAQGLEGYIDALLKACNKAISEFELKSKRKANRRRRSAQDEAAAMSGSASVSSSASLPPPSTEFSLPSEAAVITFGEEGVFAGDTPLTGLELMGRGIYEVTNLIIGRLLHVNGNLRFDIAKLSEELGDLITSTPLDHVNVTKEFKITPQQAL
mmetsp:Transcript_9558/g.18874  ORF Transcript_9558/g.18874 Transcript_9558/m.18874 type:complete len:466 (+) Transcript_9558:471-1868(+)|eukprot:CAMPEP_0171499368 /NCGR_PEP_ID=MMETSP0958-20121227/8394_1 /TAXON_ID=87120 /ORGANISM="Aurantiochytrium limacinum, Strain ATCCMYA-1381" /LENGTH=465 /DNA_ID=CAMNT_0012033925 /DNA_START=428 /DNA_END=1825 /DNA_ORIENTATION=+